LEFVTDYDRENPVTKNEGLVRVMEKKLSMAKNDEEKQAIKEQMQGIQKASVADAFSSYAMQRSVMNAQYAAPGYVMMYSMP
jgi:hypothetical protein